MKMYKLILLTFLLQIFFLYSFSDNSNNISQEKFNQYLQSKTLSFQENKGQMCDTKGELVPYVLYKAEVPGLNIWVTTSGITYQFFKFEENEKLSSERRKENTGYEWHRVDMILKDADIGKENIITENDVTQGEVNYYLGHCPNGIFNVKSYNKIAIKNVYPGIDWVLYTSSTERGCSFTHDFIVHPGADPNRIKLIYEGSGGLKINKNIIEIKTELGEISEGELLCYQGDENNEISSQYTIKETGKEIQEGFSYEVGIQTGNYNTNEILIIDPQLVWGTYCGSSGNDEFCSAATDANGNLFVTGYGGSSNFPLLDPGGGAYYQGISAGGFEICVLKFNNSGVLLWSTYYGGSGSDQGISIATDAGNNVIITGNTSSTNFPVLDAGGGAYYQGANAGGNDVFILKFNNIGVRLWATYYGGGGEDYGISIADVNGSINITGKTNSNNFPVIDPGGGAYFQGTNAGGYDIFILKFNNSGVPLWATYYGGSGTDFGYSIATDAEDNVFITGLTFSTNFPVLDPGGGAYYQGTYAGASDDFILKFNNSGVQLWATYYGGSSNDAGTSIATDVSGNMFIIGNTSSTNFPVLDPGGWAYFQGANAGSPDVFILKFNNSGVQLWATYYGGSYYDYSASTPDHMTDHGISIDCNGNVYLTGYTYSTDFPVLDPGGGAYFHGTYAGGSGDVFILEFNNTGALLWGTYNGTPNADFGTALAVDAGGCVFAIGEWSNTGSNGLLDPGGGAYYSDTWSGNRDSYIMKFCSAYTFLITVQPQDNAVCLDDSVTFYIHAESSDTVNYQWLFNGNIISGAVDSFYTVNPVTLSDTGDYSCVISNFCDADTSDVAVLTITVPNTNAGNDVSICIGSNATLSASGGATYEWNTTETTESITVNPSTTTTYIVTGTDINGCSDTDDVIVTLDFPPSDINLGIDTCISQGTQMLLDAGVVGLYTYLWNDGSVNQVYTVVMSGNYWVEVINNCGIATDTITITECPQLSIYVPNVFTPNGNGQNDMFKLTGTNIDYFELYIYDRWGNELFHTTDINEGWNGKYKGNLCPEGVYSWLIFYKEIDNTEKQKKYGHITLLK